MCLGVDWWLHVHFAGLSGVIDASSFSGLSGVIDASLFFLSVWFS